MKHLIVANWKCNPPTLKGAKLLFNSVKKGLKNIKNVEVIICPPFVWFSYLNPKPYTLNFKLGAQNCFWEEKGPFTGEISPLMLKNLDCQYVIIGHSERRKLGETDEIINKKLKAAISARLKPILCIGETEKEKKKGETFKILKTQLTKALNNLTIKQFNNLIIAYEPVWAIGTGNSCHPRDAKEVLLFLKKSFKKTPILYGGSVNSEIAKAYVKEANFQGLLVGGASLEAQEFIRIVKRVSKT